MRGNLILGKRPLVCVLPVRAVVIGCLLSLGACAYLPKALTTQDRENIILYCNSAVDFHACTEEFRRQILLPKDEFYVGPLGSNTTWSVSSP